MKSKKRMLALLLVVVMISSLFWGCGSKKTTDNVVTPTVAPVATVTGAADETVDAENPWAGIDLSEYQEINCYVVGVLGDDWQKVTDMANELMIKKINTKVNFIYVSWADFQTKYSLYLAADDDVDLIYCASWCNYTDYVKSGAFKALDWDFIQKYMPLTAENQAEISWKEASYNGSIYCIPRDDSGIYAGGVITTQSILDKYGFTKEDITDYDGLSKYLHAIAAGDNDGMYALNPQNSYPTDTNWFTNKNHMMDLNGGSATWMVWKYNTGKEFSVDDLKWFGDTQEYKDFTLEMADFYKSGIFPAGVITNETFIDDNFLQGKSAVDLIGPNEANNMIPTMKEKGEDIVYLDCTFDDQSVTRRGNYMGYGAAFPVASKNSERAAVALDCMKFDKEVNSLLVGGIEGEHYTINEADNTRELGPNAAAYPWGSWFYLLQHDSDPQLKLTDDLQAVRERYEAAEVPSETFPVNGFTYDGSKYDAQITVLNALFSEYRFSFCFGIYGDKTEDKYNEFVDKCKKAGIDDVITDFREQLAAYIEQQ
jgi:ABC-type glycerol-3-phosphate transport system substrate-binding protein